MAAPPPAYDGGAPGPVAVENVIVGEVVGTPATAATPAAPDLGARVQQMQMELDLPEEIVKDLLTCSGTDIVVIADDSSSMNTVSDSTNPMQARRRAITISSRIGRVDLEPPAPFFFSAPPRSPVSSQRKSALCDAPFVGLQPITRWGELKVRF